MGRDYGITNAVPYASAPAVGAAGDTYFNTTDKSLYQSDGTAWVKVATWTPSGTTLTPTDATKIVTIPGSTSTGEALRVGNPTIKTRVLAHPTISGHGYVATNTALNAGASAWLQDDASKASWVINLTIPSDGIIFYRQPSGGTLTNMFFFDSAGNLTIAGPVGQKSTGTTWANPSDQRIKKNIEPYIRGLAAILALAPKTFQFNGLGGSPDGLPGIGLIADDVQSVMPEMVSVTPTKLDPDDASPVDLLTLDTTALAMALVNAVKELAARVAALEAKPA